MATLDFNTTLNSIRQCTSWWKGGHVTLNGVVNNEMDKALVRFLTGQLGAFSVTNELQTVAEAKADLELLD